MNKFLDFAINKPDTLDIEELLYAGKLAQTNEDKAKIYAAATVKYPGCLRAWNNLGYTNIQLKNIAEAKANFEKANEIKAGNPIITNNLGVIALLNGDKENAQKLFLEATDAGKSVNYNLGILKIMAGDYEAAVNYFQDFKIIQYCLGYVISW
ncbi:MAG: hypothetical protein MZV63_30975 [Marinilabiliales bacterium]|nr:hypothetical protein [Marinilabiliales bacterium]